MGCAHYRHQSRGPARGRKLGPETALPKRLSASILLKCFVFHHLYRSRGPSARFFTKSLKRRAPTAVARLVCVEMLASETQERRRSTFLKNVCFCALVRLDFIQFYENACFLCPCQARLHLLGCCSRVSLARTLTISIALAYLWLLFR